MIDCIVTIHGVGTQLEGYADTLHDRLRTTLSARLYAEPVYVAGHWPPHDDTLARLGHWCASDHRTIDTSRSALGPDGTIVHIPLVYSDTEGRDAHPLAALEISAQAMLALSHLDVLKDIARMGENLIMAALRELARAGESLVDCLEPGHASGSGPAGIATCTQKSAGPAYVQGSAATHGDRHGARLTAVQRALLAMLDPGNMLRSLENDVAMYVVRNSHRERVRSFVHDAVLRLCCRDDVRGVILNTHSNGTVIGTDVLRQLPPAARRKVRALVTSGSPLRKYDDCFGWGTEFFLATSTGEAISPVRHWINFWDPRDPVADPLSGRFSAYDPQSGRRHVVPIRDVAVDNLAHSSGGGLQAHNYWDNVEEWIPAFAAVLDA